MNDYFNTKLCLALQQCLVLCVGISLTESNERAMGNDYNVRGAVVYPQSNLCLCFVVVSSVIKKPGPDR